MSGFDKWFVTFLNEKGVDFEETFEVMGPSGVNFIPVGCIVELAASAPDHEQRAIKSTCVKIDFVNGDVRHFLKHLATAVAR